MLNIILLAQALEDAGYATKKNENGELIYADTLIDLIREYNLQLLDEWFKKLTRDGMGYKIIDLYIIKVLSLLQLIYINIKMKFEIINSH